MQIFFVNVEKREIYLHISKKSSNFAPKLTQMDYLPQNPAIFVSSINMLLMNEEFDSFDAHWEEYLAKAREAGKRMAEKI